MFLFQAFLAAEDKATHEAEKRFPNDIFKSIDLERLLNDHYKMEVVLKFKIQQPLYNPLKVEGVKKEWYH